MILLLAAEARFAQPSDRNHIRFHRCIGEGQVPREGGVAEALLCFRSLLPITCFFYCARPPSPAPYGDARCAPSCVSPVPFQANGYPSSGIGRGRTDALHCRPLSLRTHSLDRSSPPCPHSRIFHPPPISPLALRPLPPSPPLPYQSTTTAGRGRAARPVTTS